VSAADDDKPEIIRRRQYLNDKRSYELNNGYKPILPSITLGLPKSANYEKLCDRIFALDGSIRFAGIIDKMGNLVAGGMRKGIDPLEPQEERRKLYLEFALRNAMRQDFDSEYGKVIYTLSEREKIKIASFPLKENLILVSIEKKAKHDEVISKVLALLAKGDN
jgi:hypothetical protein